MLNFCQEYLQEYSWFWACAGHLKSGIMGGHPKRQKLFPIPSFLCLQLACPQGWDKVENWYLSCLRLLYKSLGNHTKSLDLGGSLEEKLLNQYFHNVIKKRSQIARKTRAKADLCERTWGKQACSLHSKKFPSGSSMQKATHTHTKIKHVEEGRILHLNKQQHGSFLRQAITNSFKAIGHTNFKS